MKLVFPTRSLVSANSRQRQSGQVAVLFAISLVVLVFAGGLAIDGGFGLFQYRQAQNAADFASQAGANALVSNCDDGSVPAPITGAQLVQVIDDEVDHNSPDSAVPSTNPNKNWSAYYLNSTGGTFDVTPGDDTVIASASIIPAGACGVHVSVQPKWPPFIAQIMGFTHLQTAAAAAAVNNIASKGGATSIVALGENGAHTILEAGNGFFNVTGTIFDNANGWLNAGESTWSNSDCTPSACADTIDGKENGDMDVAGDIDAAAKIPWDWCFTGDTPADPAKCSANNTTISYTAWAGGQGQYTTDPIATDPEAPPEPTSGDAYCPGQGVLTDPAHPGGVYVPGVYTKAVVITGNATFENCSQALGQTGGGTVYEGLYVFEKGLEIMPALGDTVSGSGVVFYTDKTVPKKIDGVQNSGDGEPVLPAAVNSASCGSPGNSDNCNVDSSCGTVCNQPNPVASQGLNDVVEIGGQGTVNITAPTSGTYDDFLIWNSASNVANIGLDALPTDTASITLGGIIYDNSDQTGQVLSGSGCGNTCETYWGNDSGVPYLPGGMLVAGYGLDSSTGETCSTGAHCNVTINGLATVDLFQTQGYTDLNITGSGYQIPGIAGSGASLYS